MVPGPILDGALWCSQSMRAELVTKGFRPLDVTRYCQHGAKRMFKNSMKDLGSVFESLDA